MTNKSENPREKLYRKVLHSRWVKIVSALASVVVFCTVYALILPAITMSNQDPKCGIEEHTHIAECYDAEGNIICGLEEHAHSLSCYSDLYAAIEDEGYWSADIPELTGDRNADVLAVAQSQIGYRENDENYLISENEQTKGYTRYGHWYGEFVDTESERLENGLSYYAYKDWDAMFVSFVLNYADIYDMGLDSDAGNWAGALVDAGIYVDAADYVPQIGDLIFYTRNAGENMHVGIVSGVNRGFFGNEIKSISVIAGDSNNEVEEIKVAVAEYTEGDITFETIHGYGVLTPGYGVTDESTASEVQPDDSTVAEVAAEEIAGEDVTVEPAVEEAADASEAEEVVNLDNSADHLIGQNEESLDTVEENTEGSALVESVDGAVSEDGSEIVMNWSLSANLPDATLPAGAIIRVDTASAKVHSMTVEQARAWAETSGTGAEYATFVDNDNYEVTFIGDNGLLYSWADVQNMDAAAATSFTGIHVKAVNDVALGEDGAISFNFATTAKVADANVGQNYYVSKVNVNGCAGAATYTFENGKAETVDQNAVLRDAGIDEKPAQKTLVSKKSDYTVTMSYGPEAEIPDGSKLYVKEIKQGTEEYNQYIEDAKAALGISEEDAAELLGRFFDIKIMTKDGEFEPKALVNVNIEYKKAIETEDTSCVNAVHFAEERTEMIPVETVDVSEPEDDMAKVKSVEFSAESFSVYGIVYTVDFEYKDPITGRVYYYSLNGGESINLKDLLVILGIKNEFEVEGFVKEEVADVQFSSPELVNIVHEVEDEWILESLNPFSSEETLTIILMNGDKIVVKVTDAASSNLADMLTSVTVTGAQQQTDGTYKVEAGTNYNVRLVFEENSSTTFPRTGSMTYQFPSGIKFPHQVTGTIVPEDEHLASIYNIDYVVNTNGLATFTWVVKDGKQEEFEALEDGVIGFNINAQFDENATSIDWNGKGTYIVDQTKDINISSKNAWYDENDGKVHYQVTVNSKGVNNNVVLKDTFSSGAAVRLDEDSIHETGTASHNISFSEKSSSGFTATIPRMANNDSVTIEYTATVIYSELFSKEGKKNNYGSYDTTGNEIKFTGTDDNPNNDKKTGYANNITYSSAEKKASSGAYENGRRIEEWVITANKEHDATITYITDRMMNGADLMEYYGTGITVDVYDANGDYLNTYTKTWGELGVNQNSKNWRHDIPSEFRGEGYSYVVKYKTAVNVGDSTSSINVSNEVETDYGKGTASGEAEPRPGQKFDFDKKVNNLDLPGGTVTWDIIIDVPETGLNECTVYDYLPRIEGSAGTFFDEFDSYTVDNLIDGEVVETTESKITKTIGGEQVEFTDAIIFNFKKGDDNGLYPVDGGRQVVLHVVTKLDENWVAVDPGEDSNLQQYLTHTNTAKLNNVEKRASVTIDSTEPNAIKTVQAYYKDTFHWHGLYGNNYDLDGWSYSVYFYGLSDESIEGDTFTFTDTFDDRYLTFEPDYYEQWTDAEAHGAEYSTNNGNIQKFHRVVSYYVLSENRWYESTQMVNASVSGNTITFSIPKADIPKDDNGDYYKQYFVSYVLRVKNKATAEKMEEDAKAAGGVLKIRNTALWAGAEPTSIDVDYEVPVLDKSFEVVGNPNAGNYKFELDINKNADKLGNSDFLTVTDTVTNLTVDYSSLEFIPSDAVVAYDHSGNTLTFIVKNETAVTIKYRASALVTGKFSNTLEMNGEKVTKGGDAVVDARGTSTFGTNLHIKILKHVTGNMMDVLPNVHFKLYEYSEDAPNNYGDYIGEYQTRADGKFDIEVPSINGNKNLSKKYVLHEVDPPEGFERLPHDYYFTISKETANYGQYIYIENDTLPIANTPVHEDELTINVVKSWSGTANGEVLPNVTIRLFAKDTKFSDKSTGVEVDSYTLTAADLNSATGKWEHSFEHLDSTKTYYIVEDPVPGFKAIYTNANTLGLDRSGEIGVTNEKQKIHVEKVWEGGEPPTTMNGLNINVMKDGVFYKSYTIYPNSTTGKWELDIDDLEFPGNYTIEEEGISGWTIKSIVYNEGENQVTALTGTGNAIITNKPSTTPQEESLKVEKKWYTGDGTTELTESEKRDLIADVELVRFRKVLNGTQLHFRQFQSHTDLASVFVKKNSDVRINISVASGQSANAKFTEIDPSSSSEFYLVTNNTSIYSASSQGLTLNEWVSNFNINTGNYSDIYVALYNDIDISVTVPSNSQPEGASGEAEIDPEYTNPAVAVLNYANNWNAVFINLPKTGEGADGTKYSYSYGIKERDTTGGFELVSYTIGGNEVALVGQEGYEDATTEIETGSIVTVNNKVKNTDVEITKSWEGLDNVTVYNDQGGNQPILQNNLRIFVELERFFPDGTKDESFNGSEYIGSMYGYSRDSIGVNGRETTDATIDTSSNEWKAVWENLPGAGKNLQNEYVEYTYKVKETNVYLSNSVNAADPFALANGNVYSDVGQAGTDEHRSVKNLFTSTVSADGKTIINTYSPTSIRVDKKWKDGETTSWPDDVESITVQLYAQKQGGKKIAIKKNAETYWTLDITKTSRQIERTFENLPAKDIDGNDITYSVEEIKMTKTDGTVITASDGKLGDWAVTYGNVENGIVEVRNEKLKSFEFTKIWKTIDNQIEEWPSDKTITITLYTEPEDQVGVFELNANGGTQGDYTWTASKNADNTYTFRIEGLPSDDGSGNELVYYVKENTIDDYKEPEYGYSQTTTGGNGEIETSIVIKTTESDRAKDKQYIINRPSDAVELPNTGGSGITMYRVAGLITIVMALIGIYMNKRRERWCND